MTIASIAMSKHFFGAPAFGGESGHFTHLGKKTMWGKKLIAKHLRHRAARGAIDSMSLQPSGQILLLAWVAC